MALLRTGLFLVLLAAVALVADRCGCNPFRKMVEQTSGQKVAERPQAVCREDNGKTCCVAKWEANDTANYDISIKLPPGSHSMTMKVGPHGQEYCYWPETVGANSVASAHAPKDAKEESIEERYPVLNPVRSIFDLKDYGAPMGHGLTHAGVDFECQPNEDVMAGITGKVLLKKAHDGTMVVIVGKDVPRVGTVAYVHFSKIFVAEGDEVAAGKVIGQTESKAKLKGDHKNLHVQVTDPTGHTIDPCSVMECQ